MDAEGSVLVTQGARSVAGFEANRGKIQRLFDARAKAKAGDADAEIDVALYEGELDMIAFDEVRKRLENRKLTDEQKSLLGEVELGAMVSALHKAEDEATGKAALKTIVDAFVTGRMPNDEDRKQPFLQAVLSYAVNEEDPDLAQKAFEPLKALYQEVHGKDNPQLQQWVNRVEDKIAEMRAARKEGGGSDEGIEEGCGEESK